MSEETGGGGLSLRPARLDPPDGWLVVRYVDIWRAGRASGVVFKTPTNPIAPKSSSSFGNRSVLKSVKVVRSKSKPTQYWRESIQKGILGKQLE